MAVTREPESSGSRAALKNGGEVGMMQRRRHGRSSGPRTGRPPRPKSYRLVCAGCGKAVVVQVAPPEGKALLCMECFRK
jgi:CxxC-x17-CxxC domain-containing protein